MGKSNVPEVVGVCVVAVCTCLAVIGWPDWSDSGSQTAAAWVQAIFSIVAILASAGFIHWQHELQRSRDRKQRIDDRVEAFEPIFGMVGQAFWQMDQLHDVVIGAIPASEVLDTDVIIDDIAALVAAMDRVNVHELPTAYLCAYFLDVCRVLRRMEKQLQIAAAYWRKDRQTTLWRHELRSSESARAVVKKAYDAFGSALGSIGRGEKPELNV